MCVSVCTSVGGQMVIRHGYIQAERLKMLMLRQW